MKKQVLLLTTVLLLGATTVLPYSQSSSNNIKIAWAKGSKVRYAFNSNYAGANNNADLVRAAVRSAFQTLSASMPKGNDGQPVVTFEEDPTATALNKSSADGVNLITFTDENAADQLDPSVLAQARLSFSVPSGAIGDVDMIFNRSPLSGQGRFSTDIIGDKIFDIESIALHEGGHWLGIGHTGIASAVMSPFGESGGFPLRSLHSDDVAALLAIYGSATAQITGKVSDGTGAGIAGAHVVATNSATGITTASAVTESDGTYKIFGLTAGQTYKVFAEALDNPISLAFLRGDNSQATLFKTTFLGSAITATTSEQAGKNIQVSTPSSMDLSGFFIQQSGTQFISAYPLTLKRGTKTTLAVQGTGVDQTKIPTSSSAKVTIAANSSFQQQAGFVFVDITVAADAPTGTMDLYASDSGSALTGGLVVTLNPNVPSNGITDGAAFNQGTSAPHYAAGSMITLFGTELAAANIENKTFPVPTMLGGVSVKIGNRLAPLFFVGPGQINAMIPYELTGSTADVTVVAGGQSASAAVTIPLAASAPRIFGLPSPPFAAQAGAIVHFEQTVAQGKTVVADSSQALKAGDHLLIFCEGLGKASGSKILVTGLAYDVAMNAIDANIKVSIGGKLAQIDYAGLAPFFVGLGQINAVVPTGVPSGIVDLFVTSTTGTSNTVKVRGQ